MDSERLKQLKQQRALVQEHLDWINLEIDRETTESAPLSGPAANRLAAAVDPRKRVAESLDPEAKPSAHVAADLYDELGPDTKGAATDTKKGCLLIAAAAFAMVAAVGLYAIYFY